MGSGNAEVNRRHFSFFAQAEAHSLLSGYLVFSGEAEGSMLFLLAQGLAEISFFFFFSDETLKREDGCELAARCVCFLEP